MENKTNELILKRFCGEEYYEIDNSSWRIDNNHLFLELNFKEGTNLHEDTKELNESPSLDLYFKTVISESDIKKGLVCDEIDNANTYFYYCEYNDVFNTKLEVLDRIEDKVLFKIICECCDVNYYDGSKGNNTLEVTTWVLKQK